MPHRVFHAFVKAHPFTFIPSSATLRTTRAKRVLTQKRGLADACTSARGIAAKGDVGKNAAVATAAVRLLMPPVGGQDRNHPERNASAYQSDSENRLLRPITQAFPAAN